MLSRSYQLDDSPLGRLLVAWSSAGVCWVSVGGRDGEMMAGLERAFPRVIAEAARGVSYLDDVLRYLGRLDGPSPTFALDLRGTPFQRDVWRALRAIPGGQTRSYAEIARDIGRPDAVRAVGSACGANSVAVVIPCHRVVRGDGGLGGYRWGLEVKRALLDRERQAIDAGSGQGESGTSALRIS